MISLVVTSLSERKGFVTKLSDDTAILDFFNEFVSEKIDGKPPLAENRAGAFFSPRKYKTKYKILTLAPNFLGSPDDILLIKLNWRKEQLIYK